MKNKNTLIISGFPGVGKSQAMKDHPELTILDSDSSNFSWVKDKDENNTKERNPEFPSNYIKHIKDNIGKADIIFVSSHDTVRAALKDNNIHFLLVYPSKDCRNEYLRRYKGRANGEDFIRTMENNFNKFIDGCNLEQYPGLITLSKGEFINDLLRNDVLPYIIDINNVGINRILFVDIHNNYIIFKDENENVIYKMVIQEKKFSIIKL